MKKNKLKSLFFRQTFFACFAAAVLALAGCTASEIKNEVPSAITLMTWNVHNLFDGIDDGYEYNDFLQSSGWSTEKYLGRINTLSAAILSLEPLPDIILLQEIESLKVIQDLAQAISCSYRWSHFANNPESAIGIGIISRVPIIETKNHSIIIGRETIPRPVLETRMQVYNEEFVIFSNHWKSKRGGADVTESIRRASARVILRRIQEIWEEEPHLKIIVAGDLNVNHDDFYRRTATMCALLPDDYYAALLTACIDADGNEHPERQKDFFILTGDKPPAAQYFPQGTIVFFSPWVQELENGSYYFRESWETIDHFLLTEQFFYSGGWLYHKTQVLDFHPFAGNDGFPIPYNPRTGFGLSDHLPLLLTLKRASGN